MPDNNTIPINTQQIKKSGKFISRAVIAIIVVLIVVVIGFSCIAQVGAGQVAVVTQFGTVVGSESSGLHVKAPWHVYNMIDVTQNQVTKKYSTATKDNQSVNQEITAQVIVDPAQAEELYLRFLGNHIEGIVDPTLYDGFKAATAKYTLEETISQRDQLSAAMLTNVQEKLAGYGIQVVSVEIKNVDLPTEYVAAVERQKVAERDKVTAQVRLETAEIDAQTNEVLAQSLSAENFTKMFYEKWDGKLPLYLGGENAANLLLPQLSPSTSESSTTTPSTTTP
ncbi:MAG: prohibitin family protein [Coriobacteriales bacterium]|jgi:regulator of protease activity HflC (stomatin/prohibitin superfamily)|nr:prohibitin family protein [Coriobacteriales bacterium]